MRKLASGAALFVGACAVPLDPGSVLSSEALPTAPHSAVVTSEWRGQLEVRGDCLVFQALDRRRAYLPIFPTGSRFDGRAVAIAIPDEPERAIPLGRRVTLAGSGNDWQNVPTSMNLSSYRRCLLQPFFVVAVR